MADIKTTNSDISTAAADQEERCLPGDLLGVIGRCGRFQIILGLTIHVIKTVVCWSMIGTVFLAFQPKWRCSDTTNTTVSLGMINVSNSNGSYWNKQCTVMGQKCMRKEYKNDISTIVNEFDLVCDQAWVPATVVSTQMVGLAIGNVAAGQIADLFGRKRPLMASMGILFFGNLVSIFSPNWWMFAACRFLIGLGCSCFLSMQYSLMSEYTTPNWRSFVIGFPSWGLQGGLLALAVWLLADWKMFSLLTAFLSLSFLLAGFIVPESVRWLKASDHFSEAEDLIKRIAKRNRRHVPDTEELKPVLNDPTRNSCNEANDLASRRKPTVIDLFTNKRLLKITLPMIFHWFTLGFSAYGITFGIKKLSGSLYLNLAVFNLAQIPAKLVCVFLQNRFGRKFAALCCLFLTGIGGLLAGIVQYIDLDKEDRGRITNSLALAANVGVMGLFGPMQTLTIELYPTVVRSVSFGLLSTFGRVGAVVAPQLVFLTNFVPGILHFSVAFLTLVSAISLLLFIPETKGASLQDKIRRTSTLTNR